MKRSLKY